MTALIPFQFDNHTITIELDESGEPWFRAGEVCAALEYTNPRKAVADHVDPEDVTKRDTLTSGGKQAISFVNESGLYALIFGSKMPSAARFKRVVTSEILPSIRKTGGYGTAAPFTVPKTYKEALLLAAAQQDEIDALSTKNAAMRGDVSALERIAKADGSLSITDAAKTLQMRPKDLFDYLKAKSWIYTRLGSSYIGYQDKIAAGHLEHKATILIREDGTEKAVTQVRVTPKGLARLAKELSIPLLNHVA